MADDKTREEFYDRFSAFGRALNLVLNAEQPYSALPKAEREVSEYVYLLCKGSSQCKNSIL